jgi:hypothetical protein
MRIRGDAFNTPAGTGYHKILQIDKSLTGTSNLKLVLAFRAENSGGGVVFYDVMTGSLGAKQLGSVGKASFDQTKYYIFYAHYDPSSATEKLRAKITLDEAPFTVVLDSSSNTLITAAMNAGPTYGNVRLHRHYDGIGARDITVDGLALYSAILASGDRATEPLSTDANLLAYWPFDEGSGSSAAEINGGAAMTITSGTWQAEGNWPSAPFDSGPIAVLPGTGQLIYTGFAPRNLGRIPGGRLFTGASAARVAIPTSAALTDLAKNGRLSVITAFRIGTLATNLVLASKTGSVAARGWELLVDNVTGAGQLRFLAGGATYSDTVSPIGAVSAGVFTIAGADFDGTQGKLFVAPIDTPISEVGSYVTQSNGVTLGSDAADNLSLWNATTGSQSVDGDGIWVVIHDRVGRTTLDEKRIIQQGILTCEAGDMDRGVAMILGVSGCVGLFYLGNDGTTYDFSSNANAGTLSGTTSAGQTYNSDASGTSRNLVFAPKAFDYDSVRSPEQTSYRSTDSYAVKRYVTSATSFRAWYRRTFNDATYAAQQVIGYMVDGVYTGTLTTAQDGENSAAVSGLSASSKTIGFINAPRSRRAADGTEPQEGTFLTVVVFGASATEPTIATPSAQWAIVGDSILAGYVANPPGQKAALMQLRYALPDGADAIAMPGFGGMQLSHITDSAGAQTDWVNRIIAQGTAGVIIELGANDKNNESMSAADFETALAGLVDELIAAGYTKPIILASTTLTTSLEGANSFGDTLDDYRAANSNVASTRGPQVRYLNLKPVVVSGDLAADGAHILNSGQDKLAPVLDAAMSGTPAVASPGVGALTYAGFAPTVAVSNNRNVQPSTGALVLAGFAPTVFASSARNVLPGVGALSYSGFAPTIAVSNNKNVTPGVAALTLVGFAPTVAASNHKNVLPGVGALVLAGFAPTVSVSDNKNALAGVGVLTLNGFAPSVSTSDNRNVATGTGALVLAGFVPTVSVSDLKVVRPDVGALVYTGFAPSIAATDNRIASPDTAALVLTGFAPSVVASDHKTVAPGAGALAYDGHAPIVVADGSQIMGPGTGELMLAGFEPTVSVSANQSVAPGAAQLSYEGFAPDVVASDAREVAPGAGSLAFNGFAPTVRVSDHKIARPGVGALTYVGYAPAVSIGDARVVQVGRASLLYAGYAPSVSISDFKVARPGVGALLYTGHAPTVVALAPLVIAPQSAVLVLTGYAPTINIAGVVGIPIDGTVVMVPRLTGAVQVGSKLSGKVEFGAKLSGHVIISPA